MASSTTTNLLSLHSPFLKTQQPPFQSHSFPRITRTRRNIETVTTRVFSPTAKLSEKRAVNQKTNNPPSNSQSIGDERVQKIHNAADFDAALRSAKSKLVVVEYAASHSYHSHRIYSFMADLSRTCNDVVFLLVVGDESDKTRDLCIREKISKVPHFTFYKCNEKVHEEEGIGPEELAGDVLYYGDNTGSSVAQLHGADDVKNLIDEHRRDGRLVVLDVGLKRCGPCVKVYPTVVKLAERMKETVVFARIDGDENESTVEFLKAMDVVEVPTFLFIRNGDICGRYVGSGKGELIGEILRHQGVRVT